MPQLSLAQSITLLEKRSLALRKKLHQNKEAKKFFKKSSLLSYELRQKSARLLAGAGLIGTLLATPMNPSTSLGANQAVLTTETLTDRQKMLTKLQNLLPHQPSKISEAGATEIEDIIADNLHIPVKAYYEGQSLNHHLGYIGFEQHLKRYPGDSLDQHDDYQEAGIAPGLGAWSYFASDASKFTTQDYLREKYYCVVQTLYLSNWNQDFASLREWYKYRKVLVLNPANGQAVICDIGDAGPAEWTGKQFGGSPEVMKALDLDRGPRKGLVLIMFIDDPNNLYPLGPVK